MSFILNLVGLKNTISERKTNFDWYSIDVIYIEWHFFGLFSLSKKTVTHLLTDPAYYSRFQNEINARAIANEITDVFPRMIYCSKNEPYYYTEELSVDRNNHFISEEDLRIAQEKIIDINIKTVRKENLTNYVGQLFENIGTINHQSLNEHYELLKTNIKNKIVEHNTIELALVHGDFNRGQILLKDNNVKIVDWGDGGMFNRFFDLITITLNNNTNDKFFVDNFPKEYTELLNFYTEILPEPEALELHVLISLLEVLSVSRDEFIIEKGAWGRWQDAVFLHCN